MDYNYYAKILWDYHRLNQSVDRGDIVLAFGSHDLNVAKRAAELYLDKKADLILFTGGFGRITKEIWNTTEAEKFAQIAVEMGVSEEDILIENKATNTGENISFSKEILKEYQLSKFIIVDKPYRERRTFATLKKQWSEIDFTMTSPSCTYEDYVDFYLNKELSISLDDFISIMVGDLQRIKLYNHLGFQIKQEIPDDVWSAYEKLVELGFTKHLIKED